MEPRVPANPDAGTSAREERSFLHRVMMVYGIGILFLLVLATLWFGSEALLLLFACALFAVLLYDLSRRLAERLHMRRGVALALLVAALTATIGGIGWLVAPQIADQASQLGSVVPEAIERLRKAVAQNPFLRSILADLPSAEQIRRQLAAMVPNAGLFFTGLFGALGNAVIILCVGIYFAAQPTLYIEGFIKLIPQPRRVRARQVLDEIGDTLARWLVGKSASMLVVGAATATGLWLLEVPLALILGLIAGLLDFIPYLYTVLLSRVQLIEGYLLSPLIEARTVSLPPALTIAMQILFGTMFGMAGSRWRTARPPDSLLGLFRNGGNGPDGRQ
jgi:predicted PurR-regulated permease PerM